MKIRTLSLAASLSVLCACGGGGAAQGDVGEGVAGATGTPLEPGSAPAPLPEAGLQGTPPTPTPSTGTGPAPAPPDPPPPDPAPASDSPPPREQKILVIGDSMTSGGERTRQPYRSYRGFLGPLLAEHGCNVDIIGSQHDVPYDGGDPDHDGYPGRLVGPDALGVERDTIYDRIVGANGFATLLGPSVTPDVVVLALGWNSARYRANDAGNEYRQVVEAVATRRPEAALVLATLSPRYGETAAQTAAAVPGYRNLNAAARDLAAADPDDWRVLADLAAAGFAAGDYNDQIHWTAAGAHLAATVIGEAILSNGLLDCRPP